jgi:C4-dicarboxylate-specific signal transduction histidine kinase
MARAYQSAELQFQTTVAAATSWAAEIAHDLDSEIGHVLNRLAWLKEDENLTQIGLSYIAEIEESLSRLDRPLASVSALQSERPEEVPINQWIHRTVLSIISDKNRTENTSVTFNQGCADLTMNISRSALRSAMCYIVHNALDELEGQTPGHLIISTKSLDNYDKIEVQIEDSGLGVDEAIRDTLFQQPKTTKGKKGHGFGLIFARHLIQQMGGTLQSLPPTSLSGACFAFTLPINKNN